jgi:hypothetical protein
MVESEKKITLNDFEILDTVGTGILSLIIRIFWKSQIG